MCILWLWNFKLNPPKQNFTQKCQNCENFKILFLKLKERKEQCYQLRQQINFACQHRLHQQFNQIKSMGTKSLREPLMKISQKLLISDKATFEQLTTTEQNLCTKFKTVDVYRFLTGEEDTVPEFQYNWTSIPKLQPLGPKLAGTTPPATNPAPPLAPQAPPPAPASPPHTESSNSTPSSSPHSSPTLSTSGKRPKQTQPAPISLKQPDPSGASTSGTTPTSSASKNHNLRPRAKVDYKDLNTGALQFGRDQFRKRCSRAGAPVRKFVDKVRKMSLAELFPPISQNLSSSSTASSKWATVSCPRIRINMKSLDFAKPKLFFKNIGRYAATSTYIHVLIPFNFSQILDTKNTKNTIEQHYVTLLDKHEEPFKTIAKTTTDINLVIISASIEDFQDVIKALPQTTEIETPGRPKLFVAIGLAISDMALSSFNAYKITELNSEISALKSKTDLLVDEALHEAHLHHLEKKTDATKSNRIKCLVHHRDHWFSWKEISVCCAPPRKRRQIGSLYLANAEAIQNTCKFKVTEASERIF